MEQTEKKLETQNYESYDALYASIDDKGSLGLLAIGARGLMLWRKKRIELDAMPKPKEESAEKEKPNE